MNINFYNISTFIDIYIYIYTYIYIHIYIYTYISTRLRPSRHRAPQLPVGPNVSSKWQHNLFKSDWKNGPKVVRKRGPKAVQEAPKSSQKRSRELSGEGLGASWDPRGAKATKKSKKGLHRPPLWGPRIVSKLTHFAKTVHCEASL